MHDMACRTDLSYSRNLCLLLLQNVEIIICRLLSQALHGALLDRNSIPHALGKLPEAVLAGSKLTPNCLVLKVGTWGSILKANPSWEVKPAQTSKKNRTLPTCTHLQDTTQDFTNLT